MRTMRRLRAGRHHLRRVTLRTRILLGLGGITVLLAIPAAYAANRLSELREIAFELRSQHAVAFLALGRTRTELAEFERYVRSYVATLDPQFLEAAHEAMTRARSQVTRLEEAEYAAEAADARTRLDVQDVQLRRIAELVAAGQLEEATDALESVKPALEETEEALNVIAATIDHRTVENVRDARRISEAAAAGLILAAAVCFSLALLLGVWGASKVTAPIQRLRRAMAAVADGSFVAPAKLPYNRGDEVGALSRSFRAMTWRLQELERLRAEYAGVVTHDLKTPVNVIGGYAQLLEEGIYDRLSPGQRKAVAVIREQTAVLAALSDQLLEMSRFEAGRLAIEPQETSARELFDPVERAFSILAAEKNIEFVVDIDPETPVRIFVDAERLRVQVLGNLLSNALKFTPAGGRVTLRARPERGAVRIDVADTGVGIPEDQLPHIFDKFYRVMADGQSAGAGLGLAIAREVVEAHGGRINAVSRPGAGTTFQIVLPQRRSAIGPPRAA